MPTTPKHVPQPLAQFFAANPKVALAFSGGVDSSYLLYAALACGAAVRAYYVNSQFQPEFELHDAQRLASELKADMCIMPLDVLQSEIVVQNPADRCYHCKQVIFTMILQAAHADGFTVLMDGTNASDDTADRPGMRALQELKVVSPLRQAGLTKANVREFSHAAGLFTWDKPSYACLATRIPAGTPLTAQALQNVEQAEGYLTSLGFFDLRVRVMGNAAKLQLPAAQIPKAAQQAAQIHRQLSQWFEDVYLDLKPR